MYMYIVYTYTLYIYIHVPLVKSRLGSDALFSKDSSFANQSSLCSITLQASSHKLRACVYVCIYMCIIIIMTA